MTASVLSLTLAAAAIAAPSVRPAFVATARFDSEHATQAAAADERFFYAVSNTAVAKHDRKSGKLLAVSTGPAEHLNSGFLWRGKLYCAHSNYPKTPHRDEIKVLDPATMELRPFKVFESSRGSLTWAVHADDAWWCCFAHYGDDKGKTVLVKYDAAWKEQGVWTLPPSLLPDLEQYSLSGGIWDGKSLLCTGHDKRIVYRLTLPERGTVLRLAASYPSPFPGQGIARDPATGGLVGIDRAARQVVFARFEERH